MEFLRKQIEKLHNELRTVLGKLSLSQKISIVLLAVVVALSLVMIMSMYSNTDSLVRLGSIGDLEDIEAMKFVLESNDIDYETEGAGDRTVFKVLRKQQAQARWLAMQSGHFSAERDNLQWLWQSAEIGGSPRRETARFHESKERDLEDTIRWSRNIRNVRVTVQKGSDAIFATRTNSNDTAAVSLLLGHGVSRMSVREASSIRLAVHGAFGVPARNVQITDDRGNNYPHVESTAQLSLEENGTQARILAEIEKIYSHIFLPTEFVVGVLVDVSRRRSRIEEETFGKDPVSMTKSVLKKTSSGTRGPSSPPAVAPNTNTAGGLGSAPPGEAVVDRETTEEKETFFDPRIDRTTEQTDVPAGEIRGVSVNLVMDQAAVINIIKKEAGAQNRTIDDAKIQEEITSFVDKQKKTIGDLIPSSIVNARVHVSAEMFPQPTAPLEIGLASMTGSWFVENWNDVAMVAVALVAILVAFLMLRRAVPAPVEIPRLEDQLLVDEDRRNTTEAEYLKNELEAVKRGHLDVLAAGEDGDESEGGDLTLAKDRVVESVERLNALTKAKPHLVTSVLKNWLQDSVKDEL